MNFCWSGGRPGGFSDGFVIAGSWLLVFCAGLVCHRFKASDSWLSVLVCLGRLVCDFVVLRGLLD